MSRHRPKGMCLRISLAITGLVLLFVSLLLAPDARAQALPFLAAPEAGATTDAGTRGIAGSAEPDYGAIADLLEDPAQRESLINTLRALATARAEADPADVAPATQETSLAQQIARATRYIAEGVVADIADIFRTIVAFELSPVPDDGFASLAEAITDLAVILATVLIVFFLLRLFVRPTYRRAAQWVLSNGRDKRPTVRRIAAALGCTIIDIILVVVAWIAGYALALFAYGEEGQMQTSQSVLLNGFLIIEVVKALYRLFFATRYDGLRLLPISGEDAAYWYAWLSRITSIAGYGLLVVVPITETYLAAAFGNLVRFLVYLTTLVYGVVVILQNKEALAGRLNLLSEHAELGFARVLYGFLARTWHFLAIAYFSAFLLVSLIRPGEALPFIVAATVQSLMAIGGGLAASFLITRLITLGIHLPKASREKYPLLEARVSNFVPAVLQAVRIAIIAIVIVIVFDAWSIVNFFEWLASEVGIRVIGTGLTLGIVLLGAGLAWLVVTAWIEQRLMEDTSGRGKRAVSARTRTLLSIFRNAFTIALIVITAMIVLSELGLNIGPLLAGAGVLGLAIGFGAQKLVQDVITGIFIQLENAMNTGDVVTASGVTGIVEKLTIRSVGIRDLSGTYHLIPFSSVDNVSNFMRGFGYHVGEYGVAYRENVDEVQVVLTAAFEELRADPVHGPKIIDDLEVHGVTALADSSVNVRIRIKTLPGEQWGIGRAYNKLVKAHFDNAGIEIPFPHVTLYFGEDKDGDASPANVHMLSKSDVAARRGHARNPLRQAVPKARRRRRRSKKADEEPDIPNSSDV